MGKKSKRSRGGGGGGKAKAERNAPPPPIAPALRQSVEEEEETLDNLQFQDPFPDDYEEEVMEDEEGGEEMKDGNTIEVIQAWNPLTGVPLEPGQKLEMDESAYKMFHALTPEWPCLSFDFVRDDKGDSRTRFPHSLIFAAGTQADKPERNSLQLIKLSDLGRIKTETEDDVLGEEYNNNDESDDDSSDEEDNDVDLDPILEHFNFRHYGGVNRVRVWPQQPEIVATWSDQGRVHLYNTKPILERYSNDLSNTEKPNKDPFFVYSNHNVEGFAMDWSPVKSGEFATGDCDGHIHIWSLANSDWNTSSFTVTPTYEPQAADNVEHVSIEDLQWSPTEATVLASAECGGFMRIYDTRAPHRSMLSHKIHANGTDVNVLTWNKLVSNLVATGGDDGVLQVWDLRTFSSAAEKAPSPLARFTSHKTPITSLEWHPTDESMLAVSDDVGTYIYDLSVEEDTDEGAVVEQEVPPQLLFVHSGSEQFKEVHWHPQISSCLMTTALSGFNAFIPSNL